MRNGVVYFGSTRRQPLKVLADFEELDLLCTVPIRSGREQPQPALGISTWQPRTRLLRTALPVEALVAPTSVARIIIRGLRIVKSTIYSLRFRTSSNGKIAVTKRACRLLEQTTSPN
jgi:hypothetical protein